jgi:hypothetical protein
MSTIVILSLVALAATGLALIHETRLRQAGHNLLHSLIQSLGQEGKAQGSVRDGG